jgi:hypothetical protein
MIRVLFVCLAIVSCCSLPAQNYTMLTEKAGVAYDKNNFDSCSCYFKKAFKMQRPSGNDLYNAALCNTLGNHNKKAIILLKKAITRGINISKLSVDPELDKLQYSKGWKKLLQRAKEIQRDSFANTRFPGYAKKLSELWEADQFYRFRLGNAYKKNDTAQANHIWKILRHSDSVNLLKFENIMDSIGWPTISKVGKWGAATAFLIIDHTPREIMEKYFPMLEESAKKGEASMTNYATIKDRILVNRNQKQVYGTQKHWDEKQGKFIFFPIEDEKNVNARRKEVGLFPLEEFEQHLNK